ncbi:XTP/dITP diphosphatase [Clostridium sp. WILCCON 0269]|uniref:dITP/XTP pyrophosphatase n=1 Tax=Candidatus Clostridium eludens TaxID=3381663 RepID=A0ABW8SG48_9CLOT
MKELIVASNNWNKIKEIKKILSKYPIKVISMKEANINIDIVEDGTTFRENAYKKAKTIYDLLKGQCMVLGDDSGLVVRGLNGRPGVYSARFAGEHGNDKKNNEKLLKLLEGKDYEDRKAKFVCAMTLIIDENKMLEVEGEIEGMICDEERGENKFGYDPLFYVPEYNITFGEMDPTLKNCISHRSMALKKLEKGMKYFVEEV